MDKSMNKYQHRIIKTVAAEQLRRLYEILEDEATPFEVTVKNVVAGVKLVSIRTDTKEHAKYFTELFKRL